MEKHKINDLVNHIKNVHEAKDNKPLSFNHVRCMGVAARAGCIHLIYSMDRTPHIQGNAQLQKARPNLN